MDYHKPGANEIKFRVDENGNEEIRVKTPFATPYATEKTLYIPRDPKNADRQEKIDEQNRQKVEGLVRDMKLEGKQSVVIDNADEKYTYLKVHFREIPGNFEAAELRDAFKAKLAMLDMAKYLKRDSNRQL